MVFGHGHQRFNYCVIGWMPMLLGGDRFNSTVLSETCLYYSNFMNVAMLVNFIVSPYLLYYYLKDHVK
jgi:hypothetical protein